MKLLSLIALPVLASSGAVVSPSTIQPRLLGPLLSAVDSVLGGNGAIQAGLGALEGILGKTQKFDYIVVGAGTAGNAMAYRLAETGNKVAVIEAGAYHEFSKPVLSTVPAFDVLFTGTGKTEAYGPADWGFITTPQDGANNRKLHFAQGKAVGGSSDLNFMLYHRPTKGAYDKWAELVGDDSYSLDQMQKYYKKSVTFTPPDDEKRGSNITTPYHADDFAPAGKGGSVQVSYPNYVSPWSYWLGRGLEAAGLKETQTFNEGELMGYHYAQATIRSSDATRSTSSEYIYAAKKKKLSNLKVFTLTEATKIKFEGKKATGVHLRSFKLANYLLEATKEVIVSAGKFKSPQLLMVSGVGPEETLTKFDIPLVHSAPGVGQDMQDHVFFGPSFEAGFPTADTLYLNPARLLSATTEYITAAKGPLTSGGIEMLGWEKLPEKYRANFSKETEDKFAKFGSDWPELEFLGGNGYTGTAESAFKRPNDGKNYVTLLGCLVAPNSRETVSIASKDVKDAPVINPNWMTDKADQELAVASYRRMRDIANSKALDPVIFDEKYPGTEVKTDEQILNTIRDSLTTIWHPACTCRMGKKDDPMAVVDNEARVIGVEGLRVVDASSMALLPPGHPSGTVYALAEKIAATILGKE